MSYKNKTYIALDYDSDKNYYNIMKAWKKSENIDFDFHNAHDYNDIKEGSSEATIKKKLKERMDESKNFILLVGNNTKYLYKYVRWEIEQAIESELPIIVVNINQKRSLDTEFCPKIARETLAVHIGFYPKIIKYALDNWPDSHKKYKKNEDSGKSYYYEKKTYEKCGL